MSNELPVRVDPTASIPLATQLGQQLTWLVVSGRLAEGDELPPVRHLAEQLGINLHTVRSAYRQLAADGLLSVAMGRRARVLSFDRAKSAASTADVPTYSIGAIIPEFVSFYAPFLRGIEAAAAEQPAMVFICNAHENEHTALSYLDRLVARQVDGIVMSFGTLGPDVTLPPPGGPPVVFVDSPRSPDPGIDFDLEGAQFAVTRHLIEHGHQRIGYLSPPLHVPNIAPKYVGFERALAAADLKVDPELVVEVPDFEIRSGETAANRLLEMANPPTAIAAASDYLALGAFHAITARGLAIPDDVALVGNDDIEMAAIIRPALTTVSLPVEDAGRLAVAMLEDLIAGVQPRPSRVILDTELVVRETCGCSPTRPGRRRRDVVSDRG
jgi:DNA-binding LacI/PurR family transcriptional regulator